MKLAYVAQDRVDTAQSSENASQNDGATECAHARTQEVRSIPAEEQKMRVDENTTNGKCNVASACEF